jgi:ABC-type sugar transport system ATPase subunit
VQALRDVEITLHAGEVHALAGENGSGKSTLAKILYGFYQPDEGQITLDGEPVAVQSPRRAIELGIAAISQELTLAPTLSVAENVLMGRLPRRGGLVDWPRARKLAAEALSQLGVHVDPSTRLGTLPIELQQEVEVARAGSARSRVLIPDEATSPLSETATERLLEKVAQLRTQGVAVLLISHRMRELYAAAQKATVLRDGRRIAEVPLPGTDERELVRMMVGRPIEDLYAKRQVDRGDVVLEVADLSTHDATVQQMSFEVRAGEILGVSGLVGCGKTELGLALAGATPFSGTVRLGGRPVRSSSPHGAMRAGIGYVPEDRKRGALFPQRSVRQNLSYRWLRALSRLGVVNVVRERKLAAQTAARFGVCTRSLDAPVAELSGGNQQKVVLGRTFALAPDVVVLGEPTRGIDVGAKSEVYRYIQEMAAEGKAVVMISSELPELLGLADRIVVMQRGRVSATFSAEEATEEAIAHAAMADTGALGGEP